MTAVFSQPTNHVIAVLIQHARPILMSRNASAYKSLWLSMAGAAAACCIGRPAIAAEFDWIKVVAGGSVRNESNIFRSPEGAVVSDTISTGYVGLRLDKPYAQQRARLDLTRTQTRYDALERLNFAATDYKANWDWHATPRISGSLKASRSESLVPGEESRGGNRRNVRLSENRAFDLDWWAAGGWHLLAGVSQTEQKSEQSADVLTQPDFRSVSADAGVKYEFPSGNSVSLIHKSTRGDFLDQAALLASPADRDYREQETGLKTSWTLSPKSNLAGRLTQRARQSGSLTQRNFSGISGDVTFTWNPTSKLKFTMSAGRDETPLQDPSFSHAVRDNFSISSHWEFGAKTSMFANASRAKSAHRGSGSVPATTPAREDVLDTAEVSVAWGLLRNLTLNANLKWQQRNSNSALQNFNATTAGLSASASF